MNKNYELMGDITKRMNVYVDTSVKSPLDLLKENQIEMIEYRRLIGVQIGGALGQLVFGDKMTNPILQYEDELTSSHLLYLSDVYCPVDHIRFMTRFLIREVRIDTKATRDLNTCIESIVSGMAEKDSLNDLNFYSGKLGDTYAEKRVKDLIHQLIHQFESIFLEHIELKKCANGICRGLFAAQCINACPADVHIPGYVALMKDGDMLGAYHLMRKTNPLSLVCGKICARPCEKRCRRGEIEGTVGVRALQRYVADTALYSNDFTEDKKEFNGKTIGIIGAGPAGLSAAYFLQRTGYQVEVYESASEPGGMLTAGVPEYRMPLKDFKKEVETITNLGVHIHYNCKVGSDILFDQIRDLHDVAIIAVGAQVGNLVPDWMHNKTETAVHFLGQVRKGVRTQIEQDVLVVGGGDVAMDAARTAKRLGAQTIKIVSLEDFNHMPASLEEKQGALDEGIEFISGYGIESICGEETIRVTIKGCDAVTDLNGRFKPLYNQNKEELTCNRILLAIGQKPELSFACGSLKTINGFLKTDNTTGSTSLRNVYAIGDVVRTGIAITAIAEARKVAIKIDKNLGGTGLYTGSAMTIPQKQLSETTWDDAQKFETLHDKGEQHHPFHELVSTFDNKDAIYEASRCMRCDRNSVQALKLRP